jgi:thiosulfate dehydrogenase [quinone] large subunit
MNYNKEQYIWAILRLGMGWIFLWAFFDKLLGLGFATTPEKAWIAGGSPTFGFLKFATKGPFVDFYQSLAGNIIVDWLFMLGLLFIGLALMLGIGVKIAAFIGALMLILIYTAGFLLPEHNPFLDEHLIYAVIMIGLTMVKSGHRIGLGKWWSNTELVKKYSFLE